MRRKGSIAVYLEPWHSDIYDFLELRKNRGKEEMRARDLFLALWTPDLFMQRVKDDANWTLMCPNECKGLSDVYDDINNKAFTKLYEKYESEGKGRKTVKARDLWSKVLEAQIETGTPYILYKDAANKKSNQKNIGVIKSSNLCLVGETFIKVRIDISDKNILDVYTDPHTIDEKYAYYDIKMEDLNIVYHTLKNIQVLSFNIEKNVNEWKNILASKMMNPNAKIYKVYDIDSKNSIDCTDSHMIYTLTNGYVDAINIDEKDILKIHNYNSFSGTKLVDLNITRMVYDIKVDGNENFYANNILVHNCTEIMEVSTPTETAVCNLASLPVNMFIDIPKSKDKSKRTYKFNELYDSTYQATLNLNQIIDINYYPTKEAKKSNLKHRPIGLGVQGLADAFAILGIGFDSNEAKKLNKEIFETIYFASLKASCDLAKKQGAYDTFKGSPISKGIFQFNMWDSFTEADLSGRYDWETLRNDIIEHGVTNSLLLAPMPTASSAQILDNNEAFEPFTSNVYKRNTLSGEYVMVNKYLVEDLINLNLWNEKTRFDLITNNGSVQNIDYIPENIKDCYKTTWEISQRNIIDMAADRGLFVCQSQSMNLFIPNVNSAKLNSALFYAWEKGLKTGMYYMRTTVKSEAMKSLGISATEEVVDISNNVDDTMDGLTCSLNAMGGTDCEACGA